MQSLATVPPNTRWPVTFNVGSPAVNYTVQMTNAPADYPVGCITTACVTHTPIFQYGPTANLGPPNTLVTIDPTAPGNTNPSNFTAGGTITIVVPRTGIGNPPVGQSLSGFLTRIVGINGTAITITPDNMPDSLAPTGTYTVVGNQFCAPNTAPLANLVAHPHGQPTAPPDGDPPITIDFSGAGSSDADAGDTIASYTFDFGDGTPPVTQAGPTISHTYTTNGDFGATLKVTDSRGKISSNTALVDIGVELPLDRVVSEKVHGTGANPFKGDVILLDRSVHPDGSGEVECRTEGNGYTIIYTFGSEFTVTGQASSTPTVTNGATVATHGPGPSANQYQVSLTGVQNAQFHFITLNGIPVHNSSTTANGGNATLNNAGVQLGLLVGDVNGDVNHTGIVDSGDVFLVRQQTGQTANSANFRKDVNASGVIDSGDVFLTRQKTGSSLP
jgi:hypothetical protein